MHVSSIQYQATRVNQSKKQKGGKQGTREARASGNLGKTTAAGTVKCEWTGIRCQRNDTKRALSTVPHKGVHVDGLNHWQNQKPSRLCGRSRKCPCCNRGATPNNILHLMSQAFLKDSLHRRINRVFSLWSSKARVSDSPTD